MNPILKVEKVRMKTYCEDRSCNKKNGVKNCQEVDNNASVGWKMINGL